MRQPRQNKAKTTLRFADLPKDDTSLCGRLRPRPIHAAADYANVVEVTDAMVLWLDDCTPDQRDYFDLLCSLLEDYDRPKERRLPRASVPELLGSTRVASQSGRARFFQGFTSAGANRRCFRPLWRWDSSPIGTRVVSFSKPDNFTWGGW